MNELVLVVSLIVEFSAVLWAYRAFGKTGLYAMTVFCAIAANIEVMILIDAFGMEQTLGNVLFAASFLVTDILSENEGRKSAEKAVWLGVFVSVLFIVVSQSWFLYTPSGNDTVMPFMKGVFVQTPRVMAASLLVYAVSQRLDVTLYHFWWGLSSKKTGNSRSFLWLRNNGSTLISQLINTVLFNVCAFWGVFPTGTLISAIGAGYVIYIATSLLDTPFMYLARRMKEQGRIPQER